MSLVGLRSVSIYSVRVDARPGSYSVLGCVQGPGQRVDSVSQGRDSDHDVFGDVGRQETDDEVRDPLTHRRHRDVRATASPPPVETRLGYCRSDWLHTVEGSSDKLPPSRRNPYFLGQVSVHGFPSEKFTTNFWFFLNPLDIAGNVFFTDYYKNLRFLP